MRETGDNPETNVLQQAYQSSLMAFEEVFKVFNLSEESAQYWKAYLLKFEGCKEDNRVNSMWQDEFMGEKMKQLKFLFSCVLKEELHLEENAAKFYADQMVSTLILAFQESIIQDSKEKLYLTCLHPLLKKAAANQDIDQNQEPPLPPYEYQAPPTVVDLVRAYLERCLSLT